MMETVVEVSTECGAIEEESFPIPPDCEPAAKKKRGGQWQQTLSHAAFIIQLSPLAVEALSGASTDGGALIGAGGGPLFKQANTTSSPAIQMT